MEIDIAFTVSTGQIERIPKTQAVLTKLHTSRTDWSGTGFLDLMVNYGSAVSHCKQSKTYHVAQPHR